MVAYTNVVANSVHINSSDIFFVLIVLFLRRLFIVFEPLRN